MFEQWLVRQQAAASDLRIIREAIRDETERHVKEKTFHLIRATVETLGGRARKPAPVHAKQVWNRHRATVTRLLRDAKAHPKRKRLHALRLALKQLRYRLEWTVPQTARQRRVIFQLKKAQRCLGAYEELAAFRKLANQFKMKSRPDIVTAWRHARKNARRLSAATGRLRRSLDQLEDGTVAAAKGGHLRAR